VRYLLSKPLKIITLEHLGGNGGRCGRVHKAAPLEALGRLPCKEGPLARRPPQVQLLAEDGNDAGGCVEQRRRETVNIGCKIPDATVGRRQPNVRAHEGRRPQLVDGGVELATEAASNVADGTRRVAQPQATHVDGERAAHQVFHNGDGIPPDERQDATGALGVNDEAVGVLWAGGGERVRAGASGCERVSG